MTTHTGVTWWFRPDAEPKPVAWDWVGRGAPYLLGLRSVRRPRSGDRSRHVPVRAYSVTNQTALQLESGLEHDLVRVLDRDPGVVWLVPQPCRLDLRIEGVKRPHVPDLLSVGSDRSVTIWDVRPAAQMDDRFNADAAATGTACGERGWRYEVFAGLDQTYRLNLLWLQGFRHQREWHISQLQRLRDLAGSGTPLTVSDVLEADDGSGELVSTMWHLVWSGEIALDLAQRINGHTQLTVIDQALAVSA